MYKEVDVFGTSATIGLFEVTVQGHIKYASSSLLMMFGYMESELTILNYDDLLASPHTRNHLMLKFHQDQGLHQERILLRRKNCSNFWAELTLRSYVRGDETYFAGFLQDVSMMVALEAKVNNSENQYQRVKYELDRFIYSASHEIRSPVSSILGLINIMKLDYTDEKSLNFIELLEVSVKRLDRYILELSTFAENSRKVIGNNPIEFRTRVPEILNGLKDHPAFNHVVINFDSVGDSVFYSDLFRVRLILHHLIRNCLDFCDHSKSRSVIDLHMKINQKNVIIELVDNGIGIERTHLDKIFDMFYRASSISVGSGMGLYVTREAVTVLGGMISIHSKLGVGTSVRIELPNSSKGIMATRKLLLTKKPIPQRIQ